MEGDQKPEERRMVYEAIRRRIDSGELGPGGRLPSEKELVRQLGVSRPTVSKGIDDLVADGLVQRRAGIGAWVTPHATGRAVLGVIRPAEDPTGVLEPLLEAIHAHCETTSYRLLVPDSHVTAASAVPPGESAVQRVQRHCDLLAGHDAVGVFLAPFADATTDDEAVARMTETGVSIVLLGSDYARFPERSPYDLVGFDCQQAGYLAALHLAERGAERVRFFAGPTPSPTLRDRFRGVRLALVGAGLPAPTEADSLDPDDAAAVRAWLAERRPDGVVCGHDLLAGPLMHTLARAGAIVPRDVLVCGIDGVKFSAWFRSPLTTVEAPYAVIGRAAMQRMIERIASPDEPVRDVLIRVRLIERESSVPEVFGPHRPRDR